MRKYVFYALGEMALVILGILIALQVNNWNEDRKSKQEIETIKNNLKVEFDQNRTVLKERIGLLNMARRHSDKIIELIDQPSTELSEEMIDSILVHTLYYGNFNPSNSSIEELIQVGGLKLLNDQTLKALIFDWLQMLEDTDEDFKNQDQHATQSLSPYLSRTISMRNIDLKGFYGISRNRSRLKTGYYDEIFNDYIFENLMIDHMVWNTIMTRHYEELDQLASRILDQLD